MDPFDQPQPLLRERQRQQRRCVAAGSIGWTWTVCPAPSKCSISCASPATVGCSKMRRNGSCTAHSFINLETSWPASSEWPPSAKKSSCTPTRGSPSSSAHTSAIRPSMAVPGAT